MRKILVVLASMLVLAVLIAALAGCGGASETNGSKEEGGTTVPASTPAAAGQLGPDGKPVKTLADFPDGQDGANVEAVIKTDKGDVVLQFYPDVAPVTVASFLHLARTGFYNGTTFHRVVPGFVVQGGDPLSKDPNTPPSELGTGGPGYYLPAEFSSRKHETGTLAMARAQDPNSGGSQFYICLAAQPSLDGQYTVFGHVVSGMDVVNAITQGDVIRSITIRPKSGA
jgi:peptidyl-prolyl cis-trans isomerase B (cyclophilin B)